MPLKLDLSTVLGRAPHQVCCALDEEIVILDYKSAHYFSTNQVGAQIWTALETPKSFDRICGLVVDRFDVEPDQCRHDVGKFLTNLYDRGLIEVVS
jgi:hypothetical protein